jgi:serine/threonine protein kinase
MQHTAHPVPAATLPGARRRPARPSVHVTRASAPSRHWQEILPSQVTVDEQLGEGSYGVVYKGSLATAAGATRPVVLKKHKRGVDNAVELQEAELYFNGRVLADTQDACPLFLGVIRVDRSQSQGRLVSGLWLVWAFEGRFTLSTYLRSPNYVASLGAVLFPSSGSSVLDEVEDPELLLAQAVMRQVLQALGQLHSCGLVHRDVKPLNLVLDESSRRFKLIDLGACACLRTGKNFAPDETILDPKYSPPEEFLMPIEAAPNLAKESATIAMALGATAWARYQPDRFDMYSAGILFMQLCMPQLRTDRGLKAFNDQLAGAKHDLLAWRATASLPKVQSAVLDAFDGAGWDLAEQLLRPRPSNWSDPLAIHTRTRPSAEAALTHRFLAGVPPRVGKGRQPLARAREIARLEGALAYQAKALSDAKARVVDLAAATSAAPGETQGGAELVQRQRGVEGLLGALRAGLDRMLGGAAKGDLAAGAAPPPSAAASSLVNDVLDDEGPPEDTPTPLQRRPVKPGAPRDPVAAAAAAQKALDALRSAAVAASAPAAASAPPRDLAALTSEIDEVNQRLMNMQARMTRLLSENDTLLRELESTEAAGGGGGVARSQAGGAGDGETSSQRQEAVAAAAAAVAAAAKVAAASTAISSALEAAAQPVEPGSRDDAADE